MLFLLSTPEYNKLQSNTTKVKVHLKNGIAEILDQHQDLMGKVENNLLEIESSFENKLEKFLFILQDAVFIVSTKGLESTAETRGTGVYVYARRVREINQNTSADDILKQYEQKKTELELAKAKEEKLKEEKSKETTKSAKSSTLVVNSRIFLLEEEVEFLKRASIIIKDLKLKV
jgi:exopolysaccharide biosynthesis predicted pyruvyltransferase EpsI